MRIRRSRASLASRVAERGELAGAVFAAREELGLRQEELAELAGCSVAFVRDLEQGKQTLRLAKVSDVLNVLGLRLQIVAGADPGIGLDAEVRERLDGVRG